MNTIIRYKGEPSECRAYQLHSGDELYCNIEFMNCLGYPYELALGQNVYIYPEHNNIIAKSITARVSKVHKHKKYPNKKWWQFWIKQEEYVDGYNLTIL